MKGTITAEKELEFLRTCICKMIQGYLSVRPMPESDFMGLCQDAEKETEETEEVLLAQAPSSATQLLLDTIFIKYGLIIMANQTRNSYNMMEYENFTNKCCPSTGVFEELIENGASTMHPEDRELFRNTFSIPNLMAAHERGDQYVSVITRQLGDDSVYQRVKSTDYF